MVIRCEPGCTHGGRVGAGGLAKTSDTKCWERPKDRKLTPEEHLLCPLRGYYSPLH